MTEVRWINVVLLLLSVSLLFVTINGVSVPRHPQQMKQVTIQVNGYRPVIVSVFLSLYAKDQENKDEIYICT